MGGGPEKAFAFIAHLRYMIIQSIARIQFEKRSLVITLSKVLTNLTEITILNTQRFKELPGNIFHFFLVKRIYTLKLH